MAVLMDATLSRELSVGMETPRGAAHAPAPLRALAARLGPYPHTHGWSRYLSAGVLQSLTATAAEASPAADDCEGQEPCFFVARKFNRNMTASTTASGADATPLASPLAAGRPEGSIVGKVWMLSQDPQGCRQVQDALEAAPSNEARAALAQELCGHVHKAMRCPHANHVLAKCIALLEPASFHFIVEEITAREGLVLQFAKHRYGCRIIQQLLRCAPAQQMQCVTEVLLRDLHTLVCHVFGNYVVQVLLECGTKELRHEIALHIEKNMLSIGRKLSGGGVVGAALAHAAEEDKAWIARAVLQDPEILPAIASTRNGAEAVHLVLHALYGRDLHRARAGLLYCADKLKPSKPSALIFEALATLDEDDDDADESLDASSEAPGYATRRCGA